MHELALFFNQRIIPTALGAPVVRGSCVYVITRSPVHLEYNLRWVCGAAMDRSGNSSFLRCSERWALEQEPSPGCVCGNARHVPTSQPLSCTRHAFPSAGMG